MGGDLVIYQEKPEKRINNIWHLDKWVCFAEKEEEDEIIRKVLKYFLEEVHYPQQNIINLPQSYKAASGAAPN